VQPCDPLDRLHCSYWYIQISSCLFQVRLSCMWTDLLKHKIPDSGAQKIYFRTEDFTPGRENLVFDTVWVWREWFILYLYIKNYDKYIGKFCCHFSHKWQLKKILSIFPAGFCNNSYCWTLHRKLDTFHICCLILVKLGIRDLNLMPLLSSGHKYELQSFLWSFFLLLEKLTEWKVVSEAVSCWAGEGATVHTV
jgi:hypothetical protein